MELNLQNTKKKVANVELQVKIFFRSKDEDFTGPVAKTLPRQRAQFQSLVRELDPTGHN